MNTDLSRRAVTMWLTPVVVTAIASPAAAASGTSASLSSSFEPHGVGVEDYDPSNSQISVFSLLNSGTVSVPAGVQVRFLYGDGSARPIVYSEQGDGFEWIPSYVGEDLVYITTRPMNASETLSFGPMRFEIRGSKEYFSVIVNISQEGLVLSSTILTIWPAWQSGRA